jgi:hypothetical protein
MAFEFFSLYEETRDVLYKGSAAPVSGAKRNSSQPVGKRRSEPNCMMFATHWTGVKLQ